MREKAYVVTSTHALGVAIRHYRRQRRLTQADLAERAHLSERTIVRLEQGEAEQLRRLLRILKTLGVRMTLERDSP